MLKYLPFMAALWAAPVYGQQCLPFDEAVSQLSGTYGEDVVAIGNVQSGARMFVFQNANTGTWTVMIVSPSGNACMAGSGTDFRLILGQPA